MVSSADDVDALVFTGINASGRMSPRLAHVHILATRHLMHAPGLKAVLEALRTYRLDRSGQVGADPKHFGQYEHDHAWLF